MTEKFVAPAGEFDPAGEWVNRYALYCLIHNNRRKPVYGIRVGSLRLARRLSSARRTRLEFDYRMVVTPDAHRLAGSLLCARDELATPLEWDYRASFPLLWPEDLNRRCGSATPCRYEARTW